MRSVGPALVLLCLIAVSFEAPFIPPGFVACTHKFKGGHEWVGQINSNLCYKRLTKVELHKWEAQKKCEEYERPVNPNEPESHLPFLKTPADRAAFLTLAFNTPCPFGAWCYYWIGIEMSSYEPGNPGNLDWWDDKMKKYPRGVAQYRWDNGEMEKDWERADFIKWGYGVVIVYIPIAEHKYVAAGGRVVGSENARARPQDFFMTPSKISRNRQLAFCQKIIDSHLTAPSSTSSTPTPPLPSKRTQPTTARIIYTRRTVLVRQTPNSSQKFTRVQVIVPSSSEEEGLSTMLMYILAGGFGVLLVVAMLIAGVYGMHSKGNRRRHKRKGHKVKTNEDEPRSSTAQLDTNSSTTEHSYIDTSA